MIRCLNAPSRGAILIAAFLLGPADALQAREPGMPPQSPPVVESYYDRATSPVPAAGAGPSRADELAGFDCLIAPNSVTELSTRERGTLAEILVDRGDAVAAGQVLARLDSEVEQAAVALAKARIDIEAELEELHATSDYEKRRLSRYEELFQKNAVPFHEKDEVSTTALRAELQIRQALQRQHVVELEFERAKKALALRTLRSPVDGIVVDRLLQVGESVEERPIIKVADIDPLYAEVIVPVAHFGVIKVGQSAEVTPRYPGAEQQIAMVKVVDRVVDAASNTFGVRLELPNTDLEIPGGVRCSIRFLQ